jgi:hypothetical protein
MELIPILSMIILVATICTFLLAIGAYILYKVRERKGEKVYAQSPSTIEAELVTPMHEPELEKEPKIAPKQVTETETVYEQVRYTNPYSKTEQRTAEKYQPISVRKESYHKEERPFTEVERTTKESKFKKYTSEGYVSPKEDKNAGSLRWR